MHHGRIVGVVVALLQKVYVSPGIIVRIVAIDLFGNNFTILLSYYDV